MAITSDAGDDLEVAPQRRRAPRAGRPARPARRARRRPRWAPATISPGRLVAAHRVDGDGQHPGARGDRAVRVAELAQSTSMAWRPSYQPQLPHTTWGSLAGAAAGADAAGGALEAPGAGPAAAALGLGGLLLGDGHRSSWSVSRVPPRWVRRCEGQRYARRAQTGKASGPGADGRNRAPTCASAIEAEGVEGRPPGIRRRSVGPVGAGTVVAVLDRDRMVLGVGTGAGLVAQRCERQRQGQGLAQSRLQVDVVGVRAGRSRPRRGRARTSRRSSTCQLAPGRRQAAPALAGPAADHPSRHGESGRPGPRARGRRGRRLRSARDVDSATPAMARRAPPAAGRPGGGTAHQWERRRAARAQATCAGPSYPVLIENRGAAVASPQSAPAPTVGALGPAPSAPPSPTTPGRACSYGRRRRGAWRGRRSTTVMASLEHGLELGQSLVAVVVGLVARAGRPRPGRCRGHAGPWPRPPSSPRSAAPCARPDRGPRPGCRRPRAGCGPGTRPGPSCSQRAARTSSGRRSIAWSSRSSTSSRSTFTCWPTAARAGRRRSARGRCRSSASTSPPGARCATRISKDWLVVGRHGYFRNRSASRLATGGGTIELTSPPKRAISRISFDEQYAEASAAPQHRPARLPPRPRRHRPRYPRHGPRRSAACSAPATSVFSGRAVAAGLRICDGRVDAGGGHGNAVADSVLASPLDAQQDRHRPLRG